ncbi:MAG: glycoside hydrolase family 18 protein [Flavobacterium sp.]|nr:MAG: glycoside hydrolase family 18 protein [Flavobacterium sp.]
MVCSAKPKPIVVAYVTSWTSVIPDPNYVTHINYAFGHVNETFNGIRIDNPARLKSIVSLKDKFPKLKVMLSIGGWGSGKFSEMASTDKSRKEFADDCLRVVKEFKLDGIDIDWEYPTSNAAKISSSSDDTKNYTLMMQDIRTKIGKSKLLTLASVSDAKYIDFKSISSVVNFVNIMAYDMGNPPYHHAGLFKSKFTSGMSVDEAVTAHIDAGIPIERLVLGIPFYGHGRNGVGGYIDYKDIVKLSGFKEMWDAEAKAPYWENDKGEFVLTYETPESIAIKCEYLLKKGMLGAMYWDYGADTDEGVLRKAVFLGVSGKIETRDLIR